MDGNAKPEPSVAVARGKDAERASHPPWRSVASMMEGRSGPFRVLLAEDDAEMRRVVGDALRGDGYEVVEAVECRYAPGCKFWRLCGTPAGERR